MIIVQRDIINLSSLIVQFIQHNDKQYVNILTHALNYSSTINSDRMRFQPLSITTKHSDAGTHTPPSHTHRSYAQCNSNARRR